MERFRSNPSTELAQPSGSQFLRSQASPEAFGHSASPLARCSAVANLACAKLRSAECAEKNRWRNVVAARLGLVLVEQGALFADHEGAALLERITLSFSLAHPAFEIANSVSHRLQTKGPANAANQLGLCENLEGWIGEHGSGVACGFSKPFYKLRKPTANNAEGGSFVFECFDMWLQLHHVRAAVKSAEVSNENQDRVRVCPK